MKWKTIMSLAILAVVGGCAQHQGSVNAEDSYGFFSGLWHGLVFPFSLTANIISWLASLADIDIFKSIEIIGQPNTGFFYYFGFVVGLLNLGNAGK